jgi:hypothetical protein
MAAGGSGDRWASGFCCQQQIWACFCDNVPSARSARVLKAGSEHESSVDDLYDGRASVLARAIAPVLMVPSESWTTW